MGPMDILASLVKNQMGGSGSLSDKMRGKPSSPPPAQHPRSKQPIDPKQMGRQLEDMFGVGTGSPKSSAPKSSAARTAPSRPTITRKPAKDYNPFDQSAQAVEQDTNQALIRVMLAAAKADGKLDEAEQQKIYGQLGEISDQEMESLRDEFANDIDLHDLVWSIPFGMEQAAYQAALLSVSLDSQKEVDFLGKLQHGLRLSPQWCNETHRKYGQQPIFQV